MEQSLSYIINQLGEEREHYFGAVSPPIIQSTNFCFDTVQDMRNRLKEEFCAPFYTRGYNPTVAIVRKKSQPWKELKIVCYLLVEAQPLLLPLLQC